ncbi:NAD-dependent epimerase/dehydratase family protein [Nocardioides mangrovi]|uniref:NAD-dependent epimerase/dehydratase family protein n=1 Tax=Nocardioides mangrovi TaxID=2874580 RepID=A0ABS7UAE7_9ACTN|nr:NAD-dependent epimerase/dehydratase family protein [Nocardioides mangrovi]MBZ5737622.1 NAD-dependent epimerase/dehydratase family protein [Nocardioides mangrovi]
MTDPTGPIVVTGANGFVGSRVCRALVERGAAVRGVVRRAGTAPERVEEHVGDFGDPVFAAAVLDGAAAAVTTVHPMGSDRAVQQQVGVEATATFARAAADAAVARLVHVSTAAVYDRSPGVGDIDESADLVGEDGNDYAVTKRDTDAAIAGIDGPTRVLVRPPAILGPGETSVWNSLRPAAMREDAAQRRTPPDGTFAWVHVDDLATLLADVATGQLPGPVDGACTVVNVAAEPATQRDYYATVAGALGVDPVWSDEPAWTGRIVTDRARAWGWTPQVALDQALAEIAAGL